MDVHSVQLLAQVSGNRVMGFFAMAVLISFVIWSFITIEGHKRRKHACATPPPLPGRKRCGHGRWGWWWIPILVVLIVFVSRGHKRHRDVRRDLAQMAPAVETVTGGNFVDVDGRPVAVLDVRVELKKCEQRDVEPEDLAAGILTVIDRLAEHRTQGESARGARGPEVKELSKVLVRGGEDEVELSKVARLSRRQPLGGKDAPLGTLRIKTDGPFSSSRGPFESRRARYLGDVATELSGVLQARAARGEAEFHIDQTREGLLVRLASVEPVVEVHPEGVEDIAVAVNDPVERIVDASLSWALGPEERAEIKQAVTEARREVARETARAIAEAKNEAMREVARARGSQASSAPPSDSPAVPSTPAAPSTPAQPVIATSNGPDPDWVTSPPPQRFDERGMFTITGSTGALYATPQESHAALNEVLDGMIHSYAQLVVTRQAAANVDLSYLRSRAVTWTGSTVSESMGLKYYESHAKLELGPGDHARVLQLAQRQQGRRSAILAGVAGSTVLLLLGTVLGFLKLDTATRGFYSKRLILAASTLAVATVAMASVVLWLGLTMRV